MLEAYRFSEEVRKRSGIRTVAHEKTSANFRTLTNLPDGELLRRWKSGDEQAARLLLDRYSIRLVALVAARLNRRFRDSVDPEDVVQSAMGSFFFAAKQSRLALSDNASVWRLLATFARRKMARAIERQSAEKRGGKLNRRAAQTTESLLNPSSVSERDAEQFLEELAAELPHDHFLIVRHLLAGSTQQEIAAALSIDGRTVRRRIARIRQLLAPDQTPNDAVSNQTDRTPPVFHSQSLPQIHYREFVLGKLIGTGGFGKVYRASMQRGGQRVAVKFLRKMFWQHTDARATFLREIEAASQIDHPGVIKYLGWGQSPHGGPYVLSQWIDGKSLLEHLGAMATEFIEILRRVCEALAAVHDAGLVHGDLTPSNVLIDQAGNPILTDFGLASVAAAEAGEEQSPSFTPLGGTLGFAAPEQISRAFGEITAATDVYAVGGLIRWFLQRQASGAAAGPASVIQPTPASHSADAAQALTSLAELAAACLRPHPSERPGSVAVVLDYLSDL